MSRLSNARYAIDRVRNVGPDINLADSQDNLFQAHIGSLADPSHGSSYSYTSRLDRVPLHPILCLVVLYIQLYH